MDKLFVFDMDGTLLPGTTASIEIANITGTTKKLNQLEAQFSAGDLNTKTFAREINELWGVLDPGVIRKAFETSSKLKNIDTVLSILSTRGDHSCLITMSPHFFAELFYEYGFGHVYSSRFPCSNDDEFDVEKILSPEDKLSITKRLCQTLNVDIADVVALGDSMSDYPLFRHIVHTVSVNGTPELQELARYRYAGDDLLELFSVHDL